MADIPDNLPPVNFAKGLNLNPGVVKGGLRGALDPTQDILRDSGKVCRICLDEDDPTDIAGINPLITPCNCTGSMRYIHVQCVREWLDSKKQQQQLDGVYSYYWEELSCELCKSALKLRNKVTIKTPGSSKKFVKEYFLLNFKVPYREKYLVLESDINCLSKAIHVINFDFKREYTVGRRVTNDITVSDISVSRA